MNVIKELLHGNIIPQEASETESKVMKELLGYMARHHEDLEKTFTDEQKEIFEKFHVESKKTNRMLFFAQRNWPKQRVGKAELAQAMSSPSERVS